MADGDFRVFISAVTSEFGKARDLLATDLDARGADVRVQRSFTQGGDADTLLERLHDYIRDCNAVVCVVGKRSGASPPPKAAQAFRKMLPDGITQASYTQWEYFFAKYYGRRLYVYIADNKYERDEDLPSNPDALQDAFVEHVNEHGKHWTSFSDIPALRIAVLREQWPRRLPDDPKPKIKPIVLPYPSLGPLFKGREGFMQQLHESLSRGEQTAITSKALYGLGGIGKTRAAVEYAWAHRDDYTALLFVVAETPEALRRNLAALAATLVPELDTTDDTVRLQAVLDWLSTNPGWLLMLDNVDTKEALAEAEALLARLTGGRVILTSRLSDFSANFDPLPLDVLPLDDAVAFLVDRTKGRRRPALNDEVKAREIASELDRLALALEQAAAYIAKRKLTFDGYLERWRSSERDKVLGWFDPTVTGYPRAVAVTWQTSVAQLTEPGRHLLERLAWFAPERIPEFLLDEPIPDTEIENLHDALADLAAYSLVTRDAEGPYFLMHRLVQDVTRRSLTAAPQHSSLLQSVAWLLNAFSGDPTDVRNWPRLEPLAPHARAVVVYADVAGIALATSALMNRLGLLLRAKALHGEAEPFVRRALDIAEKEFGQDHPNVARNLNNLAQLLQETNRIPEAELLVRRALTITEDVFGLDHREVTTILTTLVTLLCDTKRFAEAEPLMRRALAIAETEFGPHNPEVAVHLTNLSQLFKRTGRLSEAEPMMRRALAIGEKTFGANHPKVALRLNNLAGLLIATDRFAEAEPLMRRTLAIDEKSFGPSHPDVAIDLNNLAKLLQATNRHAEAEPLMRRHVEIFLGFARATGHPHPHLEEAFENYAELLKDMGKSNSEINMKIEELRRGERI